MAKKQIVWKVCSSYSSRPNFFHSGYITKEGMVLDYHIGRVTRPKLGKIFAFKTRRDAIAYAHGRPVFKAEATGVSRFTGQMLNAAPYHKEEQYKKWWQIMEKTPRLFSSHALTPVSIDQFAPDGTVLCDSIKLVQRVNYCHNGWTV